MPDELERELATYGRTLRAETDGAIARDDAVTGEGGASRRWWAIAGAAACIVAAVVGLVAVSGGDRADAPAATMPSSVTTTTSVPVLMSVVTIDPERLRSAPIVEVVDGCDPTDLVVFGDFVATDTTVGEAFARAYEAMADHARASGGGPPVDGWTESEGDPLTVRYLQRGDHVEVLVRVLREGDEWRVTEAGECLPPRGSSGIQTTTTDVVTIPVLGEGVPDDPLGLEQEGWQLVQRAADPFSMTVDEIPCPSADGLADFDGVGQIHDILTSPEGNGIDLDIQILDVGSIERGNALAEAVSAIGRCVEETRGPDVETTSLSSIRATWFRAGSDFALVTIVGDGPRSIVLEIEGAPFDDELIADLARRSDGYLRGETPADD